MAFDPVTAALSVGEKLIDRLWPNPAERDAAKVRLLELQTSGELAKLTAETDMAKALLAAETVTLQAVNTTMQAEAANAANENWFQKGWRPFNGYVVGIASLAAVLGTMWAFYEALAHGKADLLAQVPSMATAVSLILAVPGAAVGITAWHRGVLQRGK